MSQVFDTLDLDSSQPDIVLDQNEDQHSLSLLIIQIRLNILKKISRRFQNELNTKYTPTSILYFNPKRIMMLQFSLYAVIKS